MVNLMGAPLTLKGRKAYEQALSTCPVPSPQLERALRHQYDILNRQIAKANGLLAYNALLFAAFGLYRSDGGGPEPWITLGSLFAMFSCLPLLALFYVSWGPPEEFETPEADFQAVCSVTYSRSHWLTISVAFSAFTSFLAIWTVWNG